MHFTYLALSLAFLGARDPDLYAVAACMFRGIAASFYATPLLDATAYPRMAQKIGISLPWFHVGNALLHALPFAWTNVFAPPDEMTRTHKRMAVFVHLAWACIETDGTFCLDKTYVPLTGRQWAVLWAIVCVVDLGVW